MTGEWPGAAQIRRCPSFQRHPIQRMFSGPFGNSTSTGEARISNPGCRRRGRACRGVPLPPATQYRRRSPCETLGCSWTKASSKTSCSEATRWLRVEQRHEARPTSRTGLRTTFPPEAPRPPSGTRPRRSPIARPTRRSGSDLLRRPRCRRPPFSSSRPSANLEGSGLGPSLRPARANWSERVLPRPRLLRVS